MPTPHVINPSIMRKYDIRGIFNQTLKARDAFYIGLGLATIWDSGNKTTNVVIGYDGRLSSPQLFHELKRGLLASGVNVISIGLVPTPVLYYALNTLPHVSAGIMITGSHNHASYNGFKIAKRHAPFFDRDITELKRVIERGIFIKADKPGTFTTIDQIQAYIKRILVDCESIRPLRIGWECSNGATGAVIPHLIKMLPGQHLIINQDIDGTFPNHEPDPIVAKNLTALVKLVKNNRCHLGIAFDGDGDRIAVVDNHGTIITSNQLISTLAQDVLQTRPGANIILDIKASQELIDDIQHAGGRAIIWKAGHSYIKAKMQETQAVFAGEGSGHIFYKDCYYGYDDGIYAALRLLNILNTARCDASTLFGSIKHNNLSVDIDITVSNMKKFAVIYNIQQFARVNKIPFNDIDGVRIDLAAGWLLIRASNTEDKITIYCEAKNSKELQSLRSFGSLLLKDAMLAMHY